jgi:hypothetical protein
MPHDQLLQCGGRRWHVRLPVPAPLVPQMGKQHILRSLRTEDAAVARSRRWPVIAQIRGELGKLSSPRSEAVAAEASQALVARASALLHQGAAETGPAHPPQAQAAAKGSSMAHRLPSRRAERHPGEIERGADLGGIFPNDEAVIRLVGALTLEQSDAWGVSRRHLGLRHLSLESLARLSDAEPHRPPPLAAWSGLGPNRAPAFLDHAPGHDPTMTAPARQRSTARMRPRRQSWIPVADTASTSLTKGEDQSGNSPLNFTRDGGAGASGHAASARLLYRSSRPLPTAWVSRRPSGGGAMGALSAARALVGIHL